MDNKRLSPVLLLYLSKTFDSISHSILLQKLSLVAADKTTKWFESHLTDRTQVVRIDTSTSTPLPITHGAPQGVILSPLLFCESLRRRKSIHYHNTRNRESLDIPPSKTKSGQRRFLHRAVNIWNNLDKDFKQLSLPSF